MPSEAGFINRSRSFNRPTFKLLSFNVLLTNKNYQNTLDYINQENPDFVALYETSEHWNETLEKLKENYPFSYKTFGKEYAGMAFFSKYPFNIDQEGVSREADPYFLMDIALKGQRAHMIAAHPQSPTRPKRSMRRNKQLLEFEKVVKKLQGPKMIFGDLNITPYSPYFKDLLEKGNLESSIPPFKFHGTYPANNFLFRIPIDHFLHTGDVVVKDKKVGPNLGSDHLPIMVEFFLI